MRRYLKVLKILTRPKNSDKDSTRESSQLRRRDGNRPSESARASVERARENVPGSGVRAWACRNPSCGSPSEGQAVSGGPDLEDGVA